MTETDQPRRADRRPEGEAPDTPPPSPPARPWAELVREAGAQDGPRRDLATRRGAAALPGYATRDMGLAIAPSPDRAEDENTARRLRVSFSSEAPYRRVHWEAGPFWEVLGHGAGEVDLSRLNADAAPLLVDHMADLEHQVGVVERAWLEDGRAHAVVRFGETERAQEVLARVRAGEVSSVSVGYGITEAREAGEAEGLPVVRVTRWEPREISFVAVPADPTVGYGRDAGASGRVTVNRAEDGEMPDHETRAAETAPETGARNQAADQAAAQDARGAAAPSRETRAAEPVNAEAIRAEARRDALAHAAEVRAIAERFDLPAELVRRAERGDMTLDQLRERALDHLASDAATEVRTRGQDIGLTERERDDFSFVRLVRHLANPTDRTAREAGFELDVLQTAADQRGGGTGLTIPTDVLSSGFGTRSQSVGAPADGGNLVPQDYRAGSFIEALRDAMIMAEAGVTMLPGLVGNVDIPKQTGEATETWLGEGDDGTDTKAAFGLVPLTPHTLSVAIPITRRMLLQSVPSIEALIRRELVMRAALGIQLAAIPGSADADAPGSLRAAIVAASGAINWATADTPTWEEVVGLESAVRAENADLGTMAYLYNATTSGALKTTKKDAGSGRFLEEMGEVNGYRRLVCNQIADPEVFFGDWSQLVIGMWSGVDIEVDRATLTASGGVVLRAFQDVDVAVRHVESFALARNTP